MKDKKLREALHKAGIMMPECSTTSFVFDNAVDGGGAYHRDSALIQRDINGFKTLQRQFTALMDYFDLEVKDVAQHMEVVEKTDE